MGSSTHRKARGSKGHPARSKEVHQALRTPETGGDNAGAGRPALGAFSMVMDQADDTEIQPYTPAS